MKPKSVRNLKVSPLTEECICQIVNLFRAAVGGDKKTAKVSLEMGNSPRMVFQHYRNLVTPAAVAEYWAIMPTSEAAEQAKIIEMPAGKTG